MHANLYATFRLLAGVKSLELELPAGATLRQAIDALVAQAPVLRSHWLDAAGELYPHVHVFVNGQEAFTLPAGLDSPVQPDDTLDFFPPVAGG